ncbi:MAG: hypothetical protein KGI75_02090 [Rhizobiaceae bacterium]|nr:hypothetical protein [Rhizobiaceae bacterium]
MKSVDDLLMSAKTVCERYQSGRIERETVREWVLRLGQYPAPTGDRVRDAAQWFRTQSDDNVEDHIKDVDIQKLRAIFIS